MIFAPNIDCGYTLELHKRGGTNEYTNSMSWIKKGKRILCDLYYIKAGLKAIHFMEMISWCQDVT